MPDAAVLLSRQQLAQRTDRKINGFMQATVCARYGLQCIIYMGAKVFLPILLQPALAYHEAHEITHLAFHWSKLALLVRCLCNQLEQLPAGEDFRLKAKIGLNQVCRLVSF